MKITKYQIQITEAQRLTLIAALSAALAEDLAAALAEDLGVRELRDDLESLSQLDNEDVAWDLTEGVPA